MNSLADFLPLLLVILVLPLAIFGRRIFDALPDWVEYGAAFALAALFIYWAFSNPEQRYSYLIVTFFMIVVGVYRWRTRLQAKTDQ